MMAIGQHTVHTDKCQHESIPVQIWNSLQGGQVHFTDADAGHKMTMGSFQLSGLEEFHDDNNINSIYRAPVADLVGGKTFRLMNIVTLC